MARPMSQAAVDDLIDDRRLDHPAVVAYLDGLSFGEVVQLLQAPETVTRYAPPGPSWKRGDPRPTLADDRPEVMAAVARCSFNRSMLATTGVGFRWFHPERCGWCEYPHAELLAAIDWWIVEERLVRDEWYVWRAPAGTYRRRAGQERIGHYDNRAAEAFHRLSERDQQEAVDRVLVDTKPPLPEDARPHEPWCSYEPDHPGDCSPHPEVAR